ncbi:hypothetical protein KUTeg_013603 [Tegillarca granosa]|uniref:Uncharacterized protein n=1 Tax=Tegillarca granosa TaxID=220873 RepID=A0ABQ9EUI6_TEGGR|nr:hypothetical protein KUTeg_013603 [Tegillarca granosa]
MLNSILGFEELINSDVTKNIFCRQRTIYKGANTNPTYLSYCHSMTSVIQGQTTISRKSNTALRKEQMINAAEAIDFFISQFDHKFGRFSNEVRPDSHRTKCIVTCYWYIFISWSYMENHQRMCTLSALVYLKQPTKFQMTTLSFI